MATLQNTVTLFEIVDGHGLPMGFATEAEFKAHIALVPDCFGGNPKLGTAVGQIAASEENIPQVAA